ncbi:mechanosensitive ion channel domain-containing protein [Tautonia plasticadhaerens]|uniref:mechanosensitive ion channel domain-containing protein n=1 Tax=Tautonia plasticadhaerens TaxID=2527974 RepID=UPI0011A92019|nr:mechanosensitive ion channel family protein [Tautonia plasticadhaerens]
MARTNRPSNRPNRSSHALGATVALTGLVLYQAGAIDASPGTPAPQDAPAPASAEAEIPVAPPDDPPASAVDAPPADAGDGPSADAPEPAPVDPGVAPAGAGMDEAEVISRLERIIRANREELEKQEALLDDGPESEYRRAEGELGKLDDEFEEAREALQAALDAGEGGRAAELQQTLDELGRRRALAKDRFELEIRERKAANEQVDILSQTIAADERQLHELLGEETPGPPPGADAAPASPSPEASGSPAPIPAEAEAAAAPPAPAGGATAAPPAPSPGIPGLPAPEADATGAQAQAQDSEQPKSEEVVKAQQEVQAKTAAAEQAERRTQSLDERLGLIDRNIATIREQLATSQRKYDNARQTRDLLASEFRDKSLADTPQAELRRLRARIDEAEDAVREATGEVRDRTARLEQLRDERDLILDAREAVSREAASARAELQSALDTLKVASNPFSARNVSRWAFTRGPGILIIVFGAALLIWVINRLDRRLVKWIADRSTRGSQAEREDRAATLVTVFQNAATAVIVIGASIMTLDQAGIPIAPILGGAAVLGLAISFGAQNLVSDFFYGFMILLENQYKLNDVVKINDHSGQVERITLRMTALRDLEGNLHFIPNGQINAVINQTHGWSRALFDIGVAYKEDADHVMEVIMELGKELRKDPKFRMLILEDPTMLGVDAFSDSAVMIKFFIKTRPLQQWAVKRELLRRMKRRFDELGIEIPFPHRTVYHRSDDEGFRHVIVEADRGLDGGNGPGSGPGNGFSR